MWWAVGELGLEPSDLGVWVKVLDGGGLWEEECKRGKKGWGNGQ